ncbi:MAG: iron-containing alcohol dehydrogenase [Magnetococcales bacterium]|nr:iron-containing alcohol dehydrogenase [Magnetococcales bacterium]
MADLIFSDRPFKKGLKEILADRRVDLIVASGFVRDNSLYADVKKVLSKQDVPVRFMSSHLNMASVEKTFEGTPFKSLLVLGGGRLIDFSKVACAHFDAELCVVLTNLSNDGFASGCSALPEDEGKDFVTVQSRQPAMVFAFHELISRMPREFILSGLGEAISKLQVMEDLRFEYDQLKIERIFCQPLEALYDLLFRDFTIHDYNDREFLFRLTTALYQYSSLMRRGSELCSRSEHEFEKTCTTNGVNLRHGTLVLLGALVSMKVRQLHGESISSGAPIFTYSTLLKVIVKFKLTKCVREALRVLSEHLSKKNFHNGLKDLSNLRPERPGLWNHIDTRTIDWSHLFQKLDRDLKKMKKSGNNGFSEVLEC